MKIGTLVSAEERYVVGVIVPKPENARATLADCTEVWVMVLHDRTGCTDFIGRAFAWSPGQLEVLSEARA
jgi:hypothetical protein